MNGYAGRTGLHELLAPNEEIKRLIVAKADAGLIKKAAIKAGMKTLLEDGAIKCMQGVSTVEEVVRIATAAVE
jgi:type II secretory ATPase GspE/PulE/Tfp pilus assembly ATPase PilB-like protein